MIMYNLLSSSSGNSTLICTDESKILIDVGLSLKALKLKLKEIEIEPTDIDAVLITHEHSDHIKGIGVLARKLMLPIYLTKGTADEILKKSGVGAINDDLFHYVRADKELKINELVITPIAISHDAAEPVAYRIRCKKKSVAIITDLGCFTEHQVELLKGLDAILLESNHDVRILETGSYPYELKQRILSNRGHLSNPTAALFLKKIYHKGLKNVVLGHLSKENNLPELALENMKNAMYLDGTADEKALHIAVAPRDAILRTVI